MPDLSYFFVLPLLVFCGAYSSSVHSDSCSFTIGFAGLFSRARLLVFCYLQESPPVKTVGALTDEDIVPLRPQEKKTVMQAF